MSQQETIRVQVSRWLDEIGDKAVLLYADLKRCSVDTISGVDSHLFKLDQKLAEARERIQLLGERESDAWNELTKEVQSAWLDFKTAGENAIRKI